MIGFSMATQLYHPTRSNKLIVSGLIWSIIKVELQAPPQAASFAISVLTTWVPPLQDQLKFNCDASFSKDGSSSSIAVVLWDWKGRLIASSTSTMPSSSVSQSEARAIRLACLLASSLSLANLHVESDNKSVIELSATKLDPPWESLAIFHDIRASGSRLGLPYR